MIAADDSSWMDRGADQTPVDSDAPFAATGQALFELDEDDRPGREVGGLHESVLETDPTGRAMRPPPGPAPWPRSAVTPLRIAQDWK